MKQIFRSKIFYLIIFLISLGIVLVFNNDEEPTEKLTDDEFFTNLADGKVTFIEVEQRKSVIEISGRLAGYEKEQYFVASVPNSETSLDRMNNAAEEHDIEKMEFTPYNEASWWVTLFTTTIPFMIISFLFLVLLLFRVIIKR
ncbi:ATP-dependent metallopeptidase FtsH/Yme1/Tma family protein [Peribacillus frigoritolerans]|uniref:ATP-dependent metallopeptidase FtsH/Yme1/Tma family protein n=1 Tax=Peribacillus frigoritolerans TaxID=450367 RepID=UPI002227AD84|nr:ATP-dependent metallopeptidase FtsH/Yme1/Tma family protein [Peribacillus frigoritolerans]UYY97980.1 ATP-dependent metallopeptidase FtsH/Yme1/Tma family protein [Peribacillus frigoritolerans]